MPDGIEVQETDTDTEDRVITGSVDDAVNAPLDEVDDPKVLRKMLKSLRNENKNARLKNKEKETELAEYSEWKKSQMSEKEKIEAQLAEERKEHRSTLIDNLALRYGVDDEFKEFITGDTKEEMQARAEKLGKLKGGQSDEDDSDKPGAALFGGKRGNAVGKDNKNRTITADDEGAWFGGFVANNGRLG